MRRLTQFKVRRLELDKLQLEVALRAGINVGRLSLIENGHVDPRPDEITRIAAALNVPVESLTGVGAAA